MIKSFWIISIIFLGHLHAEKWALCIGIDHYPQISSMPKLTHCENDIHHTTTTLELCNFPKEKILSLVNHNADIQNVHRAFRDFLSQAKKSDLVFIYFTGHSLHLNSETHWLLYNSSKDEIQRSALSLEQLTFLIKKYLKAKNIFICSDARYSKSSLGKPQHHFQSYFKNISNNICAVESSSYYKQSHARQGRSIFNYFFEVAILGKKYLHRKADYNNDQKITISELANFLSWSLSFCGYSQHPIVRGRNSFVISNSQINVEPKYTIERGWYEEIMPHGMEKSNKYGFYRWKIDDSAMVYIPQGKSVTGTIQKNLRLLQKELPLIKEELQLYSSLFADEEKLKVILSNTLQETNISILKVNKRMTAISRQIKGLEKEPEIDEPQLPLGVAIEQHIKEHIYYRTSQSILRKCYRDLQIARKKLKELQQEIDYLDKLQKLRKHMYGIFAKVTHETKGYYIDIHEITNKQYLRFCNETSRPYPPNPWWQENYLLDSLDYPVVNVSWKDAMAYALWSKRSLPSDIMWEKAARGKEAYNFPWGNKQPYLGIVNASVPPTPNNFNKQYPLLKPQKTNSFPNGRSPYGCFHMAGNVWEWCVNTASHRFSKSADYRMTKGGSFNSSEFMITTWFHQPVHADFRRSDLGFRCVTEIK
ncbi:SUMF1/EgtB/PvdO family nonheme iron enzyme [Candidatus Uabimicrobium sp. HlEnr_7]|uniref:SUMF1/EgtB/PvdO family nonheme iron enzyme n=1 Tax=Candidatus Uabimicrobium helgolandensis TaxID=3095367 RepID=UPI003558206E